MLKLCAACNAVLESPYSGNVIQRWRSEGGRAYCISCWERLFRHFEEMKTPSTLMHDLIKLRYTGDGWLPNWPPHLISDEEMCDVFFRCTQDQVDRRGNPIGAYTYKGLFFLEYPLLDKCLNSETQVCPFCQRITFCINCQRCRRCHPRCLVGSNKAYSSLVKAIHYHITAFKQREFPEERMPDWIYSYMLRSVISINSDIPDIHDLICPLGVDNIDDYFEGDQSVACFRASDDWLRRAIGTPRYRFLPPLNYPYMWVEPGDANNTMGEFDWGDFDWENFNPDDYDFKCYPVEWGCPNIGCDCDNSKWGHEPSTGIIYPEGIAPAFETTTQTIDGEFDVDIRVHLSFDIMVHRDWIPPQVPDDIRELGINIRFYAERYTPANSETTLIRPLYISLRPSTMFGEPHVIKFTRINELNPARRREVIE